MPLSWEIHWAAQWRSPAGPPLFHAQNYHSDEESGPFASIFDLWNHVLPISSSTPFFGLRFFWTFWTTGLPAARFWGFRSSPTFPAGFLKVFQRPRLASRRIWRSFKGKIKEIHRIWAGRQLASCPNPLHFIEFLWIFLIFLRLRQGAPLFWTIISL